MLRRSLLTMLSAAPLASGGGTRRRSAAEPVTVSVNLEAAAALIRALERSVVTDAEVDRLLAMRGVQAMVDNTTKYIPGSTREAFRSGLKEVVATGSTQHRFGLVSARGARADALKVIAALKSDATLEADLSAPTLRYLPTAAPLTVTVYGVVGGASDGFVLDDDPEPAFFVALDRSKGDVDGVKQNMAHELYHVAQRAARARVPDLAARVFDKATAPAPTRLLTVLLEEGTANYVVDPTRRAGSGPYFDMWRERYLRNGSLEKIASNFALFDTLSSQLRSRARSWEQTYQEGFSGEGPLYFVGYEMAKALDRRRGPHSIVDAFSRHPAAFFQAYIAVARAERLPSFSAGTESWLLSLPEA